VLHQCLCVSENILSIMKKSFLVFDFLLRSDKLNIAAVVMPSGTLYRVAPVRTDFSENVSSPSSEYFRVKGFHC
jgi:hypothetical protein